MPVHLQVLTPSWIQGRCTPMASTMEKSGLNNDNNNCNQSWCASCKAARGRRQKDDETRYFCKLTSTAWFWVRLDDASRFCQPEQGSYNGTLWSCLIESGSWVPVWINHLIFFLKDVNIVCTHTHYVSCKLFDVFLQYYFWKALLPCILISLVLYTFLRCLRVLFIIWAFILSILWCSDAKLRF